MFARAAARAKKILGGTAGCHVHPGHAPCPTAPPHPPDRVGPTWATPTWHRARCQPVPIDPHQPTAPQSQVLKNLGLGRIA